MNAPSKEKRTRRPPAAEASTAAIQLRGARVHNLKGVDVDVPLGKLTVICGVSGSGKTSLAFDTLYAEGQRRYIESFSSYARQFLQRLDRPDYDSLENLPPSIAVTRKGASRNNRSTVSANSEIDDHLRLLFAKLAVPVCIDCGRPVYRQTASSVLAWVGSINRPLRAMLAFPLHWENATDLALQLAHLQASGFVRILVAGRTFSLTDADREELAASVAAADAIAAVVDRLTVGTDPARWGEAIETTFEWGEGASLLYLEAVDDKFDDDVHRRRGEVQIDGRPYAEYTFNEELICGNCGRQYPQPDQRLFSFNSPIGACPRCEGLAEIQQLDMNKVVPDPGKSIREGAIAPWNSPAYEHELHEILALGRAAKLDVDKPFRELTEAELAIVHEGVPKKKFGGLQGFFTWLERKKYKMHVRIFASRWQSYHPCPECGGERLKPEALAFKIGGSHISQLNAMTVRQLQAFIAELTLPPHEMQVAEPIIAQVRGRLDYLAGVGLGYLQLDRPLRTLSGGELTRVNLTSVLGSNLVSMLYVLDEPTVGLHPTDSAQLAEVIGKLRDRGNTVLVVEHEPPLIRQADWLLEVGPRAGNEGGRVVFSGPPDRFASADTLTARYLADAAAGTRQRRNRKVDKRLHLAGARGRNLKNVDVEFPLHSLCVVSGVSGSGKSSLVNETLYPAVQRALAATDGGEPLPHDSLSGPTDFDECILIDQGTASRSSRSISVTLVKAFDEVRSLFAATPDARRLNLDAGHFSFNNQQGRCGTCEGTGHLQIDMIFLADIEVLCPDCHGKRFSQEVLQVRLRDRTIADVLEMTAAEAYDFFRGSPKIQERLAILKQVGLDYVQLGQTSSTLSAGELQRLKLANYLLTAAGKRALIIMDEPTTGLHFYDVERLIDCMHLLIDRGHSLIVVEHNEQILNAADWIIDVGPGSEAEGGRIVAAGPPAEVAACRESKTGYFLQAR